MSRGLAYSILGEPQRAIPDFGEAIHLGLQDPGVYANRALAYTLLAKDKEAQRDVDRAVALGFDRGRLEGDIEDLRQQR